MLLTKKVLGWISYDFANSSFTTVIVTVAYSVYFKNIVVGVAGKGDSLWGLSISLSMVLVALSAPILGSIADYTKSKKKFLFFFCYISVIFTALLYFISSGDIFLGMLFFIIANIGFEGGNIFYNAFLSEISNSQNIGKISGLGWGIGYLGGLSALAISYIFIDNKTILIFPLIGLFFGVFAIPMFVLVSEKGKNQVIKNKDYIKAGYNRLLSTFIHIKKFKELVKFLIAFFLYNDGIKTIIVFAAIYGAERFGMTGKELVTYFILANIFSFIGAIAFGYILDKLKPKKTIIITLIIWLLVIAGAYFCMNVAQFYIIGIIAGLAIGSSQSSSRTMLSLLSPKDQQAEFFGFYAISGKVSAIAGPIIYGLMVNLFKSQRFAILSIGFFFLAGIIMLQTVKEEKGYLIAKKLSGKLKCVES